MTSKNTFDRALATALKQLDKAVAGRAAAQAKVAELNAEIPRLQKIIAALRGESPAMEMPKINGPTEVAAYSSSIPSDMTGIGSYRPGIGPQPVPATEDDLLPEPDGIPVTPE